MLATHEVSGLMVEVERAASLTAPLSRSCLTEHMRYLSMGSATCSHDVTISCQQG